MPHELEAAPGGLGEPRKPTFEFPLRAGRSTSGLF